MFGAKWYETNEARLQGREAVTRAPGRDRKNTAQWMLLMKWCTGRGGREVAWCFFLGVGRGEYGFRERTALTLATFPFSWGITDEREIKSERWRWWGLYYLDLENKILRTSILVSIYSQAFVGCLDLSRKTPARGHLFCIKILSWMGNSTGKLFLFFSNLFIQQIFTEPQTYLPGSATGTGNIKVNQTQSLLSSRPHPSCFFCFFKFNFYFWLC